MSRPRMDHACARVGRDVVVFGGESSELLNLDSMTWSKGPGTGGVYFATSQVYQTAETFFNVGGSYDEDATEEGTDYLYAFDSESYGWVKKKEVLMTARDLHAVVGVPNKLFRY